MSSVDTPGDERLWPYPRLLAETLRARAGGGPIDPLTAARLAADGVATRHTPETSLRELCAIGEFEATETVLAVVGENGRREELRAFVDKARAGAVSHVADAAGLLADRAERAGTAAVDVGAVLRAAARRTGDAAEMLDRVEHEVRSAEQVVRARLGARVDALEAAGTSTAADDGWFAHVRAMIAVGEFGPAEEHLAAGPSTQAALPVSERPGRWLYPFVDDLRTVLAWYAHPERAPATFPAFVPGPDDEAGRRIVDGLRALTGASPDPLPLLAALQFLLDPAAETPEIWQHDGWSSATLYVPDDPRLPPLSFLGRTGLEIVVDGCPPESADPAGVRVRLDVQGGSGDPRAFDLAAVLGLLEHDGAGRTRTIAARRTAFLREICPLLRFRDIVVWTDMAAASARTLRFELWWLMFVLRFDPMPIDVDRLLHMACRRPRLLWEILDIAVGMPGTDPDVLSTATKSDDFLPRTAAAVCDDVGDPAAVVWFVLLWAGADTVAELQGMVDLVREDTPVDTVDVSEALTVLREKGYVRVDAGHVSVRPSGIGLLFARGDRGLDAARSAFDRAALAEQSRGETEKALALRFLEAQAHTQHRELTMAIRRLDPDRPEVAAAYVEVRQWIAEQVPISLTSECRALAESIELFQAESADPDIDILVEGDPDVVVDGSPRVLEIVVKNILFNAWNALRTHGGGTIRVQVSHTPGRPGRATIRIEDDGPGLPAEVVRALDGPDPIVSGTHAGAGHGLRHTRQILRSMSGVLELHPQGSLGGADVRIVLPSSGFTRSTTR